MSDRRPTILVCDDEASVRASIRLVLEQDYELVFAEDGEEALAKGRNGAVDLVLLDLKIPRRDGMEVLKELMARTPPPRVLVLTAYHSVELAQRATKLGALDYVTKPFERQELLETVSRALSLRDWHLPHPPAHGG